MFAIDGDSASLEQKIKNRDANILILGLGQVGLPTALAFLDAGYKTIGLDINTSLVDKLNSGFCPIPEKDFGALINRYLGEGRFSITDNSDSLANADVVIICVPTPLNKPRTNADLHLLDEAVATLGSKLTGMKLIIIESTIPPRTMKDRVIPKLESVSGRKSGVNFLVSFCPERISPGNALKEFSNNDRLIGAEDPTSLHATFELLSNVTKGSIHQTDSVTAEVSKLAENSYRDVNIAFANELALICEQNQVGVKDVIRFANTHPRVNIHSPGPGVGGPCLPKDPYLLLANFNAQNSIVRTARWINDKMPEHAANLVLSKVVHSRNSTNEIRVLILGSSYKPDVNDSRNSPTEMIVSRLKGEGISNITIHDPYSTETFGAKTTSDLYGSLAESNYVILATAHSDYLQLGPNMFRKGAVILDTVRLFDKSEFIECGLDYISIG